MKIIKKLIEKYRNKCFEKWLKKYDYKEIGENEGTIIVDGIEYNIYFEENDEYEGYAYLCHPDSDCNIKFNNSLANYPNYYKNLILYHEIGHLKYHSLCYGSKFLLRDRISVDYINECKNEHFLSISNSFYDDYDSQLFTDEELEDLYNDWFDNRFGYKNNVFQTELGAERDKLRPYIKEIGISRLSGIKYDNDKDNIFPEYVPFDVTELEADIYAFNKIGRNAIRKCYIYHQIRSFIKNIKEIIGDLLSKNININKKIKLLSIDNKLHKIKYKDNYNRFRVIPNRIFNDINFIKSNVYKD